jgi:hypothetical protein
MVVFCAVCVAELEGMVDVLLALPVIPVLWLLVPAVVDDDVSEVLGCVVVVEEDG